MFRVRTKTTINKRTGQIKREIIHAPNEPMRKIHTDMIGLMKNLKIYMPPIKDSNVEAVIQPHIKNRFFYQTDFHEAFKSVDLDCLADLISSNSDYSKTSIKDNLIAYFKGVKGGLARGGPASPILFHILCRELIDKLLYELCEKFGIIYTRYVDDLTFSHPSVSFGIKKRKQIIAIIRQAGFEINFRKTKVTDRLHDPVFICGLRLNPDNSVRLSNPALKKIKGRLYMANRHRKITWGRVLGNMQYFHRIYNQKDSLPFFTPVKTRNELAVANLIQKIMSSKYPRRRHRWRRPSKQPVTS